ncbi:MAG: hypothetical protein OXF88_06200 [Rhodobacteraceae bacterium]|nr:hypothetical protein [Paracoccaceae bacterium]MCY4139222.1 hypothetical protein [Paracoccaceae bacterium]
MAKSNRTRIVLGEQDRERLERIGSDPHSITKPALASRGDGVQVPSESAL